MSFYRLAALPRSTPCARSDPSARVRKSLSLGRLNGLQVPDKPLLKARSFDDVLGTDHHSNLTVTPETASPDILFTGNASCKLTPETTEGPYWVAGELIRENIVEDQAGVPLTLDIQVVDVNTCEVVPQAYTEIWSCNSTGVYGGVSARGNGNQADLSNLNNTMLRGIQLTDDDGVVAFDTLFPGHCKCLHAYRDMSLTACRCRPHNAHPRLDPSRSNSERQQHRERW